MSSLNSSLNLVVDELLVTIAPFFLITAVAAVVVGELNFVLNIGPWEWEPSRGFLGICHKDRGNLHDRDGLGVDDEDIRMVLMQSVTLVLIAMLTNTRICSLRRNISDKYIRIFKNIRHTLC